MRRQVLILSLLIATSAQAQYLTPDSITQDGRANQLRFEQEQSAHQQQEQMDSMQQQINEMRDEQDYRANEQAEIEMTRRIRERSGS